MKSYLSAMKQTVLDIHRDEQGAEGIEKILILAAVALPLLAVLLFFSGRIREWITDNWSDVTGTAGNENPTSDPGFGGNP